MRELLVFLVYNEKRNKTHKWIVGSVLNFRLKKLADLGISKISNDIKYHIEFSI